MKDVDIPRDIGNYHRQGSHVPLLNTELNAPNMPKKRLGFNQRKLMVFDLLKNGYKNIGITVSDLTKESNVIRRTADRLLERLEFYHYLYCYPKKSKTTGRIARHYFLTDKGIRIYIKLKWLSDNGLPLQLWRPAEYYDEKGLTPPWELKDPRYKDYPTGKKRGKFK